MRCASRLGDNDKHERNERWFVLPKQIIRANSAPTNRWTGAAMDADKAELSFVTVQIDGNKKRRFTARSSQKIKLKRSSSVPLA